MSASQPTVIGLGEVLWDVFPDSKRPGGAPANVAFQANQLGNRGLVLSAVGDDEAGRELLEVLDQKGLETSLILRDPEHPTGRVSVDLSDSGHPDYAIQEGAAWDFLTPHDSWLEAAGNAAAVCFGTLAQRSEPSREAIHTLLSACGDACLVVYDINLRQNWYERTWIERSLHAASVVKLNREEADLIGGLLEIEANDTLALAHKLLEVFDLSLVCITRAEAGCLLITPDETADVPAAKVDVVDAVGAGDAFTAALITARLNKWPLAATAKFANAVGGLVASRAGAMPELRNELAELRPAHTP